MPSFNSKAGTQKPAYIYLEQEHKPQQQQQRRDKSQSIITEIML